MSTLYSIVARGQRYIEYAALCINGLINNGNVNPNNIIVTVHEWDLNNSQFGIRILKEFGVRIETDNNNIIAKHLIVDRLFKKYQEFTHIVNIDADCIYTGKKPLENIFEIEEDIGAWTHNCCPIEDSLNRNELLKSEFKITSRESTKYNSFVKENFGFYLYPNEDWLKWLVKEGWIFGGIISYNRSILLRRDWINILKHSEISGCDETPIQYVRYNSVDENFKFKGLNSLEIEHVVNPKVLNLQNDEFENDAFIHFAGDHYRLQNESNKKIISDMYYYLVHGKYWY